MTIVGTSSLVLAATALLAGRAAAQSPDAPRAYAGAGLAVAIQPEGSPDGHYTFGSIDGVSEGVQMAAGVRVASRLSAEVEMTLTAPVSGRQTRLVAGGLEDVSVDHRETIVSALARWSFGSGKLRVEPVGGWSWVITDTHLTGEFQHFNPAFPPEPVAFTEAGTHTALTGGTDLVCLVSKRVAIAPFFRLHWVQRPEPVTEDLRGLSPVVYRVGVVVMGRW